MDIWCADIPRIDFPKIYLKLPKESYRFSIEYGFFLEAIKFSFDKWFNECDIRCTPMYRHDNIRIIFNHVDDLILFKLAWL